MNCLVVVLVAGACGDNNAARVDAETDSSALDRPADMLVDVGPRGPAVVDLSGVAYGAYWDDAAATLYLTNDTGNRLEKWTDTTGVMPFGGLPTLTTANVLGGIVQLADKSLLVPTLGMGTAGTLLTLSSDGATAGSLTGLDVTRRRIGIALDPNGLLYEAFFIGSGTMTQTGGVASVAIASGAGTETTITTSVALKKVLGIVATTTTLYVCDQTASKIYAITIADGTTTTLTTPPSCDLMIGLPSGDFVTGGLTGGVYRITSAGAVTTLRSGFEQVRGLAYDPTLKRMFAIEHRATEPTKPRLHIFPVD